MSNYKVDTVVIGAGAVGLAIAENLSNLKGMKTIANFLNKELKKITWKFILYNYDNKVEVFLKNHISCIRISLI